MITLLDKFKTVVLQFASLHDTLNLINEDDIRILEESVIYISELEERDRLARQIIKDFILENANMCREFNDNKFLFNSDYIERAEKFIKGVIYEVI